MNLSSARNAAVLLLGLWLAGCSGHVSQSMSSWKGHNFHELVISWGPPQRVFSDGNGGYIFVYTQAAGPGRPGSASATTSSTIGDYVKARSYGPYDPAAVSGYDAYRLFRIRSTGTIYGWAWKGFLTPK